MHERCMIYTVALTMGNFDSVLEKIGPFGRYQMIYWILCGFATIPAGMHHLANVYLQATPTHWCHVPELANLSAADQIYIMSPSGPWTHGDGSCSIKKVDYSEAYKEYMDNITLPENATSVPCSRWTYNYGIYGRTAVTKWDLVCSKNKYPDYAQFVYMLGVVIGASMFGHISDRFGRKLALCSSLNGIVVFGVVAAFVPEIWSYVFLRMLTGICAAGALTVACIACMENMGAKWRALPGIYVHMYFMVGYLILSAVAYLVKDFVWTTLIIGVLPLVMVPYWCIIPESARWLVSRHRIPEAKAELQRAADINRISADLEQLMEQYITTDDEEVKKYSAVDLFRTSTLRRRSFIILFSWFTVQLAYFGVSVLYREIIGNIYLNSLVLGVLEIVMVFIIWFFIGKIGRRFCYMILMTSGGAAFIFSVISPPDYAAIPKTLLTLARLCVCGANIVLYTYTPELYPTVVRNIGLGLGSSVGHTGAMVAALVTELRFVWTPLPSIVFGVLSVVAGLLTLSLPETLNQALPDTMEEAQHIHTQCNISGCDASSRKKPSEKHSLLEMSSGP